MPFCIPDAIQKGPSPLQDVPAALGVQNPVATTPWSYRGQSAHEHEIFRFESGLKDVAHPASPLIESGWGSWKVEIVLVLDITEILEPVVEVAENILLCYLYGNRNRDWNTRFNTRFDNHERYSASMD
ncbi:hypothetical protein TESG_06130 [Trichophyton tonsurans CBS 112818]|uniref:Uncharacterized protein n=1 Tax=Trichophyton tonsurans (strain CBS 112818) TaxID=647933 RepID=F2S501_TRIT1|nr:hypothetical protein TESG_06130 [Trichophyton tonsurans CBS 112818]